MLKPRQVELLQKAKASNGGGVWGSKFKESDVTFCVRQGFLTEKKGQYATHQRVDTLYVITPGGRQQLLAHENIVALVEKEAKEDGLAPTIQTGAPWD